MQFLQDVLSKGSKRLIPGNWLSEQHFGSHVERSKSFGFLCNLSESVDGSSRGNDNLGSSALRASLGVRDPIKEFDGRPSEYFVVLY